MKSIQSLKYLLLVAPFNAIAHPHPSFMDHDGPGGSTDNIFLVALVSTALAGLVFFLKYARRRKA